jgi:hypothetical protein
MTNEKSNMENGKSRVPFCGGLRIVDYGIFHIFSILDFSFEPLELRLAKSFRVRYCRPRLIQGWNFRTPSALVSEPYRFAHGG